MRFLFVHQNFPAQFVHVAVALAKEGHQVAALGEARRLKQKAPLHPAIKRLGYELPKSPGTTGHAYLRSFEAHILRGQVVARGCLDLLKKGFQPDVVVAHPGWGEALFLKDIFPKAIHIHFCEFFYSAEGADVGFDPEFPLGLNDRLKLRIKNSTQLISLDYMDAGVTPTAWQKSRYPEPFQSRIEVLHEGINTREVTPNADACVRIDDLALTAKDEIVTYVARNLEPYRGFHILIKMLPALLAQRPNARVLIVGGDAVSYGSSPADGNSWKAHCFDPIRDQVDVSRIHFLGNLPYHQYLHVLQISTVHLYLTYPFVLSWSMLEAMAAECLVIGSATPPVQECLRHEENGLLCDFFDVDAWVKTTVNALENREELRPLRQCARQTILERYDLETVCLPRYLEFLKQFG